MKNNPWSKSLWSTRDSHSFFFPGDSPDHQTTNSDLIKLCKNNKHNLKYGIYAIDIELTKLGIEERGSEIN